ncbi:MAG: desulfoferrodoxin FeS4 iron-binding domain-containing protein [Patescibacteria group bacterium]|nr:desulfoferrodoxin FeS4 iron-binding domain-containing protein [Patescibacteria group bacterium]
MTVKTVSEHYRCNICGNEVRVTKVGGGTLVCCGQDMELVGASEQKSMDDEIPA